MGTSRASKYMAAGKEVVATALSAGSRIKYGRKATKYNRYSTALKSDRENADVRVSPSDVVGPGGHIVRTKTAAIKRAILTNRGLAAEARYKHKKGKLY